MSRQLRILRLDATQHATLHGMNAATRLCAGLSEAEQLVAQRAALRDVSSGIRTVSEAVARLSGRAAPPSAPPRRAADAVRLLGGGDPRAAAMALVYARAAWVSEQQLAVDLGAATRERRRARCCAATAPPRWPSCPRTPRTPPTAASAGAWPARTGPARRWRQQRRATRALRARSTSWASARRWWPSTRAPAQQELRCAKRSSASLRAAIAFEAEMQRRCVECEVVDESAVREALSVRVGHGIESGIAASACGGMRARRSSSTAPRWRAAPRRCCSSTCSEGPCALMVSGWRCARSARA